MDATKPCAKCGGSERDSYGRCKACGRAYAKARRLANPKRVKEIAATYRATHIEKEKARGAKYRAENKEASNARSIAWNRNNAARFKEKQREWRLANLDKLRAAAGAWAKANPEAKRIINQNRRARAAGGKLSSDLADKLFKLQKGKCACCGEPLGDDYHRDHVMPLALGGPNIDDNIQLLRKRCNLQKKSSHPIEFMQSKGFLL